jgi:hypothetical protein
MTETSDIRVREPADRVNVVCAIGFLAVTAWLWLADPAPVGRGAALMALVALGVAGWLTARSAANEWWAWFAMLTALGALAGALLGPAPAQAQNAPTYRSAYEPPHAWHRDRRPHRHHHVRKVWRHEGLDDARCKPVVAVVGDQYATPDGAREEADKAWMQTARWQHGERYMDRAHAADATYECGRSSVGSVVGQIFVRCRLAARPCRAAKEGGEQ